MRRGRHRIRSRARGQRINAEHNQRTERRRFARDLSTVVGAVFARARHATPEQLAAWRARLIGEEGNQ